VRFGNKKLYLSCKNGGPKVISVKVNGEKMKVTSPDEIDLFYAGLPENSNIEITTGGGWPDQQPTVKYAVFPSVSSSAETGTTVSGELTESMKKPFAILSAMKGLLSSESDCDYDIAFVAAAIKSFDDYRARATMDPGPGYFRPITSDRRDGINNFYEQTALTMYNGLANRMATYSEKGDSRQKHIAELFSRAQK
jgi:hypothetical protein